MLSGLLYIICSVCLTCLFLPNTILYRYLANEKKREALANDNNNNYTPEAGKSVNDSFSFLIYSLLTHQTHPLSFFLGN